MLGTTEPDLAALGSDTWCRELVDKAIARKSGALFGGAGYSNHSSLALVFDNIRWLKAHGMYESALLEAYIGCKYSNARWDGSILIFMFEQANKQRLRKCGAKISAPVTAYRGINGIGKFRRRHGLSWTKSIDVACWFARRGEREKPRILQCEFEDADIFCYWIKRGEQEIIGIPRKIKDLAMDEKEIQQRAAVVTAEREARQQEEWRKLRAKQSSKN